MRERTASDVAAPGRPTAHANAELLRHDNSPAPLRTVLIVIEEPVVRALIAVNLRHAGMFAMAVASLQDGQRLANEVRPDVIVLDLDAVGADQTALLAGLTQPSADQAPLTVMLSSRPCGRDEIGGGTRLYMQKPFSAAELMARIGQQLQAPTAPPPPRPAENKLRHGVLELDIDCMSATVRTDSGPQTVDLAVTETKLLQYLMTNANRANRREDILGAIWGDASSIDIRTIDQHIRRLRRNFERIGAASLIRTVYGFGYRLDDCLAPVDQVATQGLPRQTPVSVSTSSARSATTRSPASAAATERARSKPVSIRRFGTRP